MEDHTDRHSNHWHPVGLISALLVTAPFWTSGIDKLFHPVAALGEARELGLSPGTFVVACTIFLQLGASALLIARRLTEIAAIALSLFTVAATLIAHRFWEIADPLSRFHERTAFIANAGLVGGLLALGFIDRIRRE